MVSTIAWLTLLWYLIALPFDLVLLFVRNWSELVCFAFLWWKMTMVNQFILLLDAIVLVRYFLIFKCKNPEAFKDDFWHRYLTLWSFLARYYVKLQSMKS